MPFDYPRILIVDDDPDSCEVLSIMLELDDDRYEVKTCYSFAAACELIAARPYDLYIFDYLMPEILGPDFCRYIRTLDVRTPILFYSGVGTKLARDAAYNAGADLFLVKPNDLDRISNSVSELLARGHIPTGTPRGKQGPTQGTDVHATAHTSG